MSVVDRFLSGKAKSIPTTYRKWQLRSRFEAEVIHYFQTRLLLPDEQIFYEPRSFRVDGTDYCPDFFIPALSLWIEVRGYSDEKGEAQIRGFIEVTRKEGWDYLVVRPDEFGFSKREAAYGFHGSNLLIRHCGGGCPCIFIAIFPDVAECPACRRHRELGPGVLPKIEARKITDCDWPVSHCDKRWPKKQYTDTWKKTWDRERSGPEIHTFEELLKRNLDWYFEGLKYRPRDAWGSAWNDLVNEVYDLPLVRALLERHMGSGRVSSIFEAFCDVPIEEFVQLLELQIRKVTGTAVARRHGDYDTSRTPEDSPKSLEEQNL
jgi:hypothetical protein